MGTIVIEEYGDSGAKDKSDAQVFNLKSLVDTEVDAATSTTPKNITLSTDTRLLFIEAVETHRVSIVSDTTATIYATIIAGKSRDFGVDGGETLYFRADA